MALIRLTLKSTDTDGTLKLFPILEMGGKFKSWESHKNIATVLGECWLYLDILPKD